MKTACVTRQLQVATDKGLLDDHKSRQAKDCQVITSRGVYSYTVR
jgi:hypothetical protein